MKHTNRQPLTKTLTDLYRAIDRRNAVTITYTDHHGATSVRTIEPYELRTTAAGDIEVRAMCRLRGKAREFTLSTITAYTVHRTGFVLERPANTTYEPTPAAPADNADALFWFELARGKDDTDYRPPVLLTQAHTGLAA